MARTADQPDGAPDTGGADTDRLAGGADDGRLGGGGPPAIGPVVPAVGAGQPTPKSEAGGAEAGRPGRNCTEDAAEDAEAAVSGGGGNGGTGIGPGGGGGGAGGPGTGGIGPGPGTGGTGGPGTGGIGPGPGTGGSGPGPGGVGSGIGGFGDGGVGPGTGDGGVGPGTGVGGVGPGTGVGEVGSGTGGTGTGAGSGSGTGGAGGSAGSGGRAGSGGSGLTGVDRYTLALPCVVPPEPGEAPAFLAAPASRAEIRFRPGTEALARAVAGVPSPLRWAGTTVAGRAAAPEAPSWPTAGLPAGAAGVPSAVAGAGRPSPVAGAAVRRSAVAAPDQDDGPAGGAGLRWSGGGAEGCAGGGTGAAPDDGVPAR
ncbi:hypothetical protein ACH4OY_03220 [Micromonospora rubida]|uniref:PE-PGRS family protein n=1 Tax=Micromonospora rubida TaxID=2697657 RepID=A0ABW7SDD6_9ACTN